MLEFHYQEKYVNVTFTDFNITTKQVGTRPDSSECQADAEQRASYNFE